ncbi:MAG TPA: CPBP family intramembrane glutamic endopeptidase [Virgibacillus sp.]|nr:CPBP family intramembrane glutamic endopeptidase [Virgibacillus sp.]HLR69591.1 CPBP family intramembrane glutamic endopeptidase [Virgibacillus sp.]
MLKKYLLLTFSITFLCWGVVAVYTQVRAIPFGSSIFLLILYLLGVLGPAIASVTIKKRFASKNDYIKFLKNCYRPPKNTTWYLFILTIVLAASLLPYFIVGGNQVAPIQMILLSLPLFILIGGLEEIGWRGFMLPELTKLMPSHTSTLLVGIVWLVWHLPLFFIIGTYQHEHLNIFAFTVTVISLSFLLSTVYFKTNSIFLCIITHALYNSVLDVFIIVQSLFGEIVVFAFALFIFILFTTYRNKMVANNN